MNRLTIKELHIVKDVNKALDKLSKLEDILEKYAIIDLEQLDQRLEDGVRQFTQMEYGKRTWEDYYKLEQELGIDLITLFSQNTINMNRLTIKELHIVKDVNKALDKLSKLEDILEKYAIIDLEQLDQRLEDGVRQFTQMEYGKRTWEDYYKLEQELGIDLITLFSQKYEQSCDLEVEKNTKTIYFCGDSYYGHWAKEQWLNIIKEAISAYRELAKLDIN